MIRKRRLFLFLSVFFIFFSMDFNAWAQWQSLGGPAAINGSSPEIQVLSSSDSETLIEVTVKGFERTEGLASGVTAAFLSVPGMSLTDRKGYPALPRMNRNIAIPLGSKTSLKVIRQETVEVDLGRVAPSRGAIYRNQNPKTIPYRFEKVYRSNRLFPVRVAKISEPFQFRDLQGVNLSVRPFQYRAKSGKLLVTRKLLIKLTHTGGLGRFSEQSLSFDPTYSSLYKRHFLNMPQVRQNLNDGRVEHVIEDTGRLLIVSHPAFQSAMASFIKWKTQRGLWVKSISTSETGRSHQQIKSYISNEYLKNNVSQVILVGDAEHIPPFPGTEGNAKGNEADPMYGLIEGLDSYPEVMVSRISAKSAADVSYQAEKFVRYEKNPDPKGSWYQRASGIASDEGSPTDGERAEWLRQMLLGWHYDKVDKFYDPGVTTSDLASAVNSGVGYVNYIGHGTKDRWVTANFKNSDIDKLKNGSRLPFIVSVACVNGDFMGSGVSFAEKWMLAGSSKAPKGAVSIFASSTNQSWVPPTVGQKEITRLLTSGEMSTIGMLFTHGSVAVLEDNSSTAVQTFQTWHIFGDASLQVRSQRPSALNSIVLPGRLKGLRGVQTLRVGEPGIHLGVTADGELVAAGISDPGGEISYRLNKELKPGTKLTFTLTGKDKFPAVFEQPVGN